MISTWIITVIAIIGCGKLLFDAMLALGRWVQKVEPLPADDARNKPKVTLDRLSWEIENIASDIKTLQNSVDNRYAELAAKVTSDHQLVREMLNWRAGLVGDLTEKFSAKFHTKDTVDRIVEENEKDRKDLWEQIKQLHALVDRRGRKGSA